MGLLSDGPKCRALQKAKALLGLGMSLASPELSFKQGREVRLPAPLSMAQQVGMRQTGS